MESYKLLMKAGTSSPPVDPEEFQDISWTSYDDSLYNIVILEIVIYLIACKIVNLSPLR